VRNLCHHPVKCDRPPLASLFLTGPPRRGLGQIYVHEGKGLAGVMSGSLELCYNCCTVV
jgi:hypothetical protein